MQRYAIPKSVSFGFIFLEAETVFCPIQKT